MNAPTLPPNSSDKAATEFSAMLAKIEAGRRPNDGGLLRALAEGWQASQPKEKTP